MVPGKTFTARGITLLLIAILTCFPGKKAHAVPMVPDQPQLTSITNTASGVQLTWDRAEGARGYQVNRTTPADDQFFEIGVVTDGKTTSFLDTKAEPGQVYGYTIVAFYAHLYSDYDTYGTYICYLKAPALKTPKNTKAGIKLQWGKSVGCEGYILYRKEGNGSYKALLRLEGESSTSYTDTTAKPGTTYKYYVKSYYKRSLSPRSSIKKLKRSSSATKPEVLPSPASQDQGTYRALLVGQTIYDQATYNPTYPFADKSINLYATKYDVQAMKALLKGMNYSTVKVAENLTASSILSKIKSTFASAKEGDVSLFYYSGHGRSTATNDTGALLGVDREDLSLKDLAAQLKKVPGSVIVVLDSCGSGAAVHTSKALSAGQEAKQFNAAAIQAFRGTDGVSLSTGEFRKRKFYVITSSAAYQDSSYQFLGNLFAGSYMTIALASSGGFAHTPAYWNGLLPADANGDKAVTIEEAYQYITKYLKEKYSGVDQDTQRYPIGSSFVMYHH